MMNKNLCPEIWWDDENKLARGKAVAEIDEAAALIVTQERERIAQQQDGEIDWMIDLTEVNGVSSKARKMFAQTTGHPSIRKFALVGASVFIRTVSNFISTASGQKKVRHFATEREALQWMEKD